MSTIKKFILSVLVVVTLLPTLLVPVVSAQGTWYNQNIYEWYIKVYDEDVSPPSEIFGERYTAAQVQWVFYSIVSTILGFVIRDPNDLACFFGVLSGDGIITTCFEGLLNLSDQGTSTQYYASNEDEESLAQKIFKDRPLSGITYIKNIGRKFKLIPEAKAQGFGFTTALNPFQGFWRASRDISYGMFVIAIIILAFMIMFRVKLSPQTVISVQSAIPKVVIAILLVTFSYAIAGFLVDLLYVVIGVVSLLFSSVLQSIARASVPPGRLFDFLTVGPRIANIPLGIVGTVVVYNLLFALAFIIGLVTAVGGLVVGIVAVLVVIMVAVSVGTVLAPLFIFIFILLLIGVVMVIMASVKTTGMLIRTFVNVILLTMFAPFFMILGIFVPSFGFGKWLKEFVSNLAVFVVVGVLLLLSFVFLAYSLQVSGVGNALLNILLGGSGFDLDVGSATIGWPPYLSVTDGFLALLYLSVSFTMFNNVSKAADIVKGFMSGRPVMFGTAVGEAAAPIAAVGGYAVGVGKSAGESVARGWLEPRLQGLLGGRDVPRTSRRQTKSRDIDLSRFTGGEERKT
jgi:hypothetical protein